MARRSTRQTRAPNRFGVEEELVQSEIPDQPVNRTDEQEAESDHTVASGSVNDVSRGNQPPPMDLHQILAMQTHIIQGMVQNIIAMQQQHTQERQPHMVQDDGKSKLNDFLGSRPPEFSQTNEPIEADDWIKDMERKLNLVQCTPQEKTLYAAHQLRGPAADWWDNYCATHTDASTIVWTEFAGAFRSAHIPERHN
jgi:Retrotransposon gag protein.